MNLGREFCLARNERKIIMMMAWIKPRVKKYLEIYMHSQHIIDSPVIIG